MKPVCSDKQARGAAPAERSGHMTGNQIGEKIQSHIWFHCFGKIKQLLEEMDPPVLALWRTFTQLKIWPQVYLSLTWDCCWSTIFKGNLGLYWQGHQQKITNILSWEICCSVIEIL